MALAAPLFALGACGDFAVELRPSSELDPATVLLSAEVADTGDAVYNLATKEPSAVETTIAAWRDSDHWFGASHGQSLAYEARPFVADADALHPTQKIMHELLPLGGSSAERRASSQFIRFGERRFVGLAFKVDDDATLSQVPESPTIVFQVWQGSPFSPIVAASLIADAGQPGGLRLRFDIRNNDGIDRVCVSVGSDPIIVGDAPVTRGKWYSLIFGIEARPSGDANFGELSVWMADGESCAQQACPTTVATGFDYELVAYTRDHIGYEPGTAFCDTATSPCCAAGDEACLAENPEPCPKTPIAEGGLVEVGVYRPNEATWMRVFFDEVRIGRNYGQVAPESAAGASIM